MHMNENLPMSPQPIDLSSLDPTRDPAFDERVSAIVRAARVGSPAGVVCHAGRGRPSPQRRPSRC
jgi:hypothetical protein